MKIQSDHSSRINKDHPKRTTAKRQKTPVSESKSAGKEDTVEFSSRADEVRRLTELAESVPDVRLDKIDSIKKKIKAGTYSVSADSVARSIADFHKKLKCDDR